MLRFEKGRAWDCQLLEYTVQMPEPKGGWFFG